METPSHTARAAAAAGTGPNAHEAAQAALTEVGARLDGTAVTLAVVFLGAAYADQVDDVRQLVVDRLAPEVLVGVTAQGVIAGPTELETAASLSIWAAALPGATVTPLRCPPGTRLDDAPSWPDIPADAHGLVVLADPFTFLADAFLAWAHESRPRLPVMGGLASGAMQPGGNRLLLDGEVYRDGAVAVALGGTVTVTPLVSQGCRPIGPSYAVTGADGNVIRELGGQRALDRVDQLFAEADDLDRRRMQAGLHIGLAVDEYADDHELGDFLVRNVRGADRDQGAVAVGDLVSLGQTVRFHLRDADSADQDLRQRLARPLTPVPEAALLFTCNGRGSRLFGTRDHDAELVHEALGGVPVAGFFAAGELGPVGGRSHLHGFTASLMAISTSGG